MLETAKLIVGLLPLLIELVKAIEAAIPQQGAGAAKLTAVRDMLTALVPAVDTMWPAVETIVAALVKLFNATGVFKRD